MAEVLQGRAYPKPIPRRFHPFPRPESPPREVRPYVAGFMTRFATYAQLPRTPFMRNSHAMPVAPLLWDRSTPAPMLLRSV
jgi:hypothetical protein